MEIFLSFVDRDMIEHLVRETKKYAEDSASKQECDRLKKNESCA